jgi:hypothetical protein
MGSLAFPPIICSPEPKTTEIHATYSSYHPGLPGLVRMVVVQRISGIDMARRAGDHYWFCLKLVLKSGLDNDATQNLASAFI